MSHDFCRTLLAGARAEAKRERVQLPKRITALRADRSQFFVEMDSRKGEYVSADCAYEAKAKFISSLVDKAQQKVAEHTAFRDAVKRIPRCLNGYDPLHHKTVADLIFMAESELNLWNEGEPETDIKNPRDARSVVAYVKFLKDRVPQYCLQ